MAVAYTIQNYSPNIVLNGRPPPPISKSENLLPRPRRTTLSYFQTHRPNFPQIESNERKTHNHLLWKGSGDTSDNKF